MCRFEFRAEAVERQGPFDKGNGIEVERFVAGIGDRFDVFGLVRGVGSGGASRRGKNDIWRGRHSRGG